MRQRSWQGFWFGVVALMFSASGLAAEPVPERRVLLEHNVDYPGGDLQMLSASSLSGCQTACLARPDCLAFTHNNAADACFLKQEVKSSAPYDGATSGRVILASEALRERAGEQRAALPELSEADFALARTEAEQIGLRHARRAWGLDLLRTGADERQADGNFTGALDLAGAAVAESDADADWLRYSRLSAAAAENTNRWQEQQTLKARAVAAAVNAWLRAGSVPQQVEALQQLATALEAQGRGRDAIAPLRLAESLAPSASLQTELDRVVGQYGFRVVEHDVEADSAMPRICAYFSEPLVAGGVNYNDYVALSNDQLVVAAEDQQLCVEGVEHGERYTLTLRAGLPAASGEALRKSVTLTQYVRDRSPTVSFAGNAYVLPSSPQAAIPVQTVNLDRIELALYRLVDRNLVRAAQEGLLLDARLPNWRRQMLSDDIGELVWQGSAEVELNLNQEVTTRLPLHELGEELHTMPGIYALQAMEPGLEPWQQAGAVQWFVVSNLGVAALDGQDGLHVFVRKLNDVAPAVGAEVQLINRANRVVATRVVDDSGVAHFDAGLLRGEGQTSPAMVVVRDGENDLTFLSLTEPAWDLSDRGVAGRESSGAVDLFVATDRGVYRPGDTFNATVLVRDDQGFALPDLPVALTVRRPDGVIWWQDYRKQGEAGGHVVKVQIGTDAPRGVWRLEAGLDPNDEPLVSQTFWVEDFLPERIDVRLELPQQLLNPEGSPPTVQVQADTLFGVPAAGLAVEAEVMVQPLSALEDWPGYRFGPTADPGRAQRQSLDGIANTDADGITTFPLVLPPALQPSQPARARVSVRVIQDSGRPVERQLERIVRPAGPTLGVRPLFDGTVADGGNAEFELMALNEQLEPVALEATYTLQRLETRYQWYELHGQWRWEPLTRRDTVASGTVALGDQPSTISHPVEWGRYELRVEHHGEPYTVTTVPFRVGGAVAANAIQTPDALEVALDQDSYQVGDTAQVRIQAQADGQALVMVLTDRLVTMEAVPVVAGENLVSIPVTDDWGTGVYVAAMVVRPVDQAAREPVRAVGLAHAAVNPGDRYLSVSFDAPPEVRPAQSAEIRVRVEPANSGGEGNVANASQHSQRFDNTWLTLAAVDVGILNLTQFAAPDPADHYFGQRRLGVDMRDLYGRLIQAGEGAQGRIRSGGGADIAALAALPTDVLATYFTGPLPLEPDGTATLEIPVPEFDGTLRLMAIVWNEDAVGAAAQDMLVRDPVVIQSTLPRFLAPGDQSQWHLTFDHVQGPAGEMSVAISADGLELEAEAPETLDLAEGQRVTIDLPLQAGGVGDAHMRVLMQTPDGQTIERSAVLGVRSLDPAVSHSFQLELEAGHTHRFDADVLAAYLPATASLQLSVGTDGPLNVPQMVSELLNYPYACTEQLVSRLTPLLTFPEIAAELMESAELEEAREHTLNRILARQAANGAFGMWDANAGDAWLSAYVTDFLLRARRAGWQVPDVAWQNAIDNLRNQLSYAGDFKKGGEVLAYALWVLAQAGQANIGDLRYYADEKAEGFATPLARAQLGAALALMNERERSDRLFELAMQMLLESENNEPAGWRVDYGTLWRDAAAVLALANEVGSSAISIEALEQRLAEGGDVLSPQEASWGLWAAAATPATTDDVLDVNGQAQSGPWLWNAEDTDWPVTVANPGSNTLRLQALTRGVPREPVAAGGNGYTLKRERYTLDGEPHSGEVKAGERYVMVLTIQPLHDRGGRLIVDDPLPAGFEIDNPHLFEVGESSAFPWLSPTAVEFAEFRAERFLAAVNIRSANAVQLAYVVRAVVPGNYHYPAAKVEDMYQPRYSAWTDTGELMVGS